MPPGRGEQGFTQLSSPARGPCCQEAVRRLAVRRASDFPHDAWWFGRSARRGADSRGASPFTPGEVRARAGKGDPSRAPWQGPLTTCQSHLLSDKGPSQVGGSNGRTGVEGCQCGLAFASVGAGGPGLRESECGREGKEGAGGGHGGVPLKPNRSLSWVPYDKQI